jgi:hypothetical protein
MATRDVYGAWITAQADGTEHFVTDAAQVAGMGPRRGWYEAVCQKVSFRPAAMETGPRRRCRDCGAIRRNTQPSRKGPKARVCWLSRLPCPLQSPADAGSCSTPFLNSPTSAGVQGASAGGGVMVDNKELLANLARLRAAADRSPTAVGPVARVVGTAMALVPSAEGSARRVLDRVRSGTERL